MSSIQGIPSSEPKHKAHSQKHWAVVGGGIMGLVTALRLVEKGERVTLLESAPKVGGLTSTWQLGSGSSVGGPSLSKSSTDKSIVEWDKYYHVILLSDSRIRAILKMLDLDDEIEWVQTKTGFYSKGQLYPLSSSIDFLRFPPLNLYQKFRLGSTIFLGSKIRNWRAMEKILVGQWLQKWSGKSTYEKIWKPLLKAKLGKAHERTAASFIWAYIDRMYKARRSGMKRELFGYVPGGYKRIIEGLAKHLNQSGVRMIANASVQRIENLGTNSEGRPAIQVEYKSGESTIHEDFDRVVFTVPYPAVDRACNFLTDDERNRLQSTEYLGVICTSLLLDKPLSGYYVTNIIDDWVPLTGIIEMGTIVPQEKLGGNYLVYLPQYMLSSDSRFEEDDSVVHERCIDTLEKMYPEIFKRSSVVSIQSARAKFVMALPTLNFSQTRPPVVLSQPGVYLLNSARIVKGTLNVNETLELLEEELAGEIWPNHLELGK